MIQFAFCDSLQYRGVLITFSDSFHLICLLDLSVDWVRNKSFKLVEYRKHVEI